MVPVWGQPLLRIAQNGNTVELEAVAPNILRVHVEIGGRSSPRTLVMDPSFQPHDAASFEKLRGDDVLVSPQMSVVVHEGPAVDVQVKDADGNPLISLHDLVRQAQSRQVAFVHDENEDLYGINGLDRTDTGAGILRNGGGIVAQGVQGNGGAPFVFTRRYGVLVDSDGGSFEPLDETLRFQHDSRPDVEFFVIVGKPMQTMEGLMLLTGRPPMPPKWTLGFLNSQWGSTEQEILSAADTYSAKHIPISGFLLDFDWKAWGEDDYGEWRWNSTAGAGNSAPDKFPDGASGKFAADLMSQHIHLAGILKPRILIDREDGTPTEASAYATAHGFWYPNEIRVQDYVTHRLAGNIDFNNAEARAWFWEHLRPAFKAGMTAWWNDEADYDATTTFNNFQFLNMSRALWDGQRADSTERVWSINRAYYLGSTRYGAAEWSGDISTGFQSMAYQRRRMIATLDLGLPHWSMDTGGFGGGTPTPENYARWMEFAAFVPIDRVHGGHNQKRQPWVYGPVAEAAAKRAIRLRYDLMPYIYSNEREARETGIGIVRPLFWAFPDDPKSAEETRSWMFGDALLVSPVVAHGETVHTFYLPPGTWFEYATGHRISGGRELQVPVDSSTWQDIPLYIRAGSIVATQPSDTDSSLDRTVPLTLDIFPSTERTAVFTIYDDDGHTYAYEKGAYFRQQIAATQHGNTTDVTLEAPTGSYISTISAYVLRIHYSAASVASKRYSLHRFSSVADFNNARNLTQPAWTLTQDHFGPVTLVRLPASHTGETSTALTIRSPK